MVQVQQTLPKAANAKPAQRRTRAEIGRAIALLDQGDAAGAVRACRAMLARDARCLPARLVLASGLLALGSNSGGSDWRGALAEAETALTLDAESAPAHFIRGTALHALGRANEAVDALRTAVRLAPGDASSWLNLGNALATLDRADAAEAALARACALDPGSAIAHASRATALVQRLRLPEAIAAYTAALGLRPDFSAARWDRGFARLLAGDFRRGWADLRDRKPEENTALRARGASGAEWDGTQAAARLLVCSGQGLGDAIQFARYVPMLAARGSTVLLTCDARLARLLRGLPGVATVVAADQPPPAHDAWVALSSLPRLFATEPASIPAAAGYLRADPALVASWRAALPSARPKVGLVWAGNPAHGNDARRSMPPAALARLLAVPEVRFFNLQRDGEAAALGDGVFNLAPRLTDLAETAAAVTALDLVITVDTAVAHLCGALGRPAWIALPYAPDWRWQLGRANSPWYNSVTLFRQPAPGDWTSVMAALANRLDDFRKGTDA